MDLKELSGLFMQLQQTPGFVLLVKQLEEGLEGRQKGLLLSKPDPEVHLKLAKIQGFAECLALIKAIPQGSATSFKEMQDAELAIWGATSERK